MPAICLMSYVSARYDAAGVRACQRGATQRVVALLLRLILLPLPPSGARVVDIVYAQRDVVTRDDERDERAARDSALR